jgi:hypothetical protein
MPTTVGAATPLPGPDPCLAAPWHQTPSPVAQRDGVTPRTDQLWGTTKSPGRAGLSRIDADSQARGEVQADLAVGAGVAPEQWGQSAPVDAGEQVGHSSSARTSWSIRVFTYARALTLTALTCGAAGSGARSRKRPTRSATARTRAAPEAARQRSTPGFTNSATLSRQASRSAVLSAAHRHPRRLLPHRG